MGNVLSVLIAVLTSMSAGPAPAGAAPDDTSCADEKAYKPILDAILPSAEESRWKRLGWRSELWGAVQEAKALQRPILLWAMNGHPLGCT